MQNIFLNIVINKLYLTVIFYGVLQEKFEYTKEVTRSRKSEKDTQYNDYQKKNKKSSNDIYNTTQKKNKKSKNDIYNTTQKKNKKLKNDLRSFGRVSSSCRTSGTCRVTLVINKDKTCSHTIISF